MTPFRDCLIFTHNVALSTKDLKPPTKGKTLYEIGDCQAILQAYGYARNDQNELIATILERPEYVLNKCKNLSF